jgi:hypothetical protein
MEAIRMLELNKEIQEYEDNQEKIKQMCIEYSKTYFQPPDTEALIKYFEENNGKLKFYIDEQGRPNFQDG